MNQEDKDAFLKPNPERGRAWMKRHPVITGFGVLIFIILVVSLVSGSGSKDAEQVAQQPQTLEERMKSLTEHTGTTDIVYIGIDNEKADSDRPEGSRMVTAKFNVTKFYKADSLLRDTSELTGKVLQEIYKDTNVYDVIVWYYADTTDKYGNKENEVLISQAIDKPTFQKIKWQNFDSRLCDFLNSEGAVNHGNTTCVIKAAIK